MCACLLPIVVVAAFIAIVVGGSSEEGERTPINAIVTLINAFLTAILRYPRRSYQPQCLHPLQRDHVGLSRSELSSGGISPNSNRTVAHCSALLTPTPTPRYGRSSSFPPSSYSTNTMCTRCTARQVLHSTHLNAFYRHFNPL